MKKRWQCEHKPSKLDKLVPDISSIIASTLPKLVLVVVIKFFVRSYGLSRAWFLILWLRHGSLLVPDLAWTDTMMQHRTAAHTPDMDRVGKGVRESNRDRGKTRPTTLQHMMWSGRHSLVPSILLVPVLSSNHNLHLICHVISKAETCDVCPAVLLHCVCVCVWARISLDTTARVSSEAL